MARHPQASDASNTMIRAFLIKVGELHLSHSFNVGSGAGKKIWNRIKEDTFNNSCAYCEIKESSLEKLTMDHLIGLNREECGLHHPGNVVPACKSCNNSKKKKYKKGEVNRAWMDYLEDICLTMDEYKKRKKRIMDHRSSEDYPKLTDDEINSLKAVASHLYSTVQSELDKSLNLFKQIDFTLVKGREN